MSDYDKAMCITLRLCVITLGGVTQTDLGDDAADRIEALTAENKELWEIVQWFVDNDETNEGDTPLPERGGRTWDELNAFWIAGLNRARAALAGKAGQ